MQQYTVRVVMGNTQNRKGEREHDDMNKYDHKQMQGKYVKVSWEKKKKNELRYVTALNIYHAIMRFYTDIPLSKGGGHCTFNYNTLLIVTRYATMYRRVTHKSNTSQYTLQIRHLRIMTVVQ